MYRFFLFLGISFCKKIFGVSRKVTEVVVDSKMSCEQALCGVNSDCPNWILKNQAVIEICYFGFDHKLHKGQLVADFRLADELQHIFTIAYDMQFPIRQITPISKYRWDDLVSMKADNSSAFNYRAILFSKKLSKHAYGWAIDINPVENPYFTKGKLLPKGAQYQADQPGTLSAEHKLVTVFKDFGWCWGGDWTNKDYQHFDKELTKAMAKGNKHYYKWSYD